MLQPTRRAPGSERAVSGSPPGVALARRASRAEVGVDHHLHQLARTPPSASSRARARPWSRRRAAPRPRRAAGSAGRSRRAARGSSPTWPKAISHASRTECIVSGRDHVVVGLVLLQHQPHRAHVVAGEAPVALRVEVAQAQLAREPELDARHAVGDLARHELEAAPRRLVVEEDAADRVHAVALAVVDRDPVAVGLRDAVGAARVERRLLGLRHLLHLAEHLRRGRLVEADRRVDVADRLEHARDADGGELGGQHRLRPRGRHEALRGEVVDLVRLRGAQRLLQRGLVEQVGLQQLDAARQVRDALERLGARAAHDAVDLVALVEQQLGEVRAVLAGDSGDERAAGGHGDDGSNRAGSLARW